MEIKKVLKISQAISQIILESGGEIYRVEETIERICSTYGVNEVNTFVTPSVIMISVENTDSEPTTIIKRIKSRTVDFNKIEEVNCLSRRIVSGNLSEDEIYKELDRIKSIPSCTNLQRVLFSGLIAGSFTVFFGGDFIDFLPGAFIGILIRLLLINFSRIGMNDFFMNIVGGAFATFLALLFDFLNISSHPSELIIGSIMLLVPGLGITNGIRDTISGDLLSGITRTIEAFFVAIAIAIGSSIIYQLYFMIFGGLL